MGRTGTLVSILVARFSSDRPDVPEIVLELRERRHKNLVVESIVNIKFFKCFNIFVLKTGTIQIDL